MSAWTGYPLTYADTEASGLDADAFVVTACIGDLGAAPGEDAVPLQFLLRPPDGRPIPEGATEVHGITTEQALTFGVPYEEGLAQIVEALNRAARNGRALVAYNLAFDWSLITREAHRLGLPLSSPPLWLDPMVVDKGVDRYRKGKRTLVATCAVFGVEMVGDAHDAMADAVAAGELARRMQTLVASASPDSAAAPALKALHSLDAAAMNAWQREERGRQMDGLRDYFDRNGIEHDGCDGGWPVTDAVAAMITSTRERENARA